MGQNQLVLVILGAVIVGIAIVVGINFFTSNSGQADRDAIIADLRSLAVMAQQYYKENSQIYRSFDGWEIPERSDSTGNGTYSADVSSQSITFIGIGNEKGNDGTNFVVVTIVINSEKIISTKINN
jgi:type II secretory pathway pseudopilin PulG